MLVGIITLVTMAYESCPNNKIYVQKNWLTKVIWQLLSQLNVLL